MDTTNQTYPIYTKTRGGSPAIVFANLTVGNKPLVGVYFDGVTDWIPVSWTIDGWYDGGSDDPIVAGLDIDLTGGGFKQLA